MIEHSPTNQNCSRFHPRIVLFTAALSAFLATPAQAVPIVNDQPPEAGIWGIWDLETSMDPNDPLYQGDWLRGSMISVDWKEIKPTKNGAYQWGPLDTKLTAGIQNLEQGLLIVYHADAAPNWIYNGGCSKTNNTHRDLDGCVPWVAHKPGNQNIKYPDYYDPDYEIYLKDMILNVANHIKSNSDYLDFLTIIQCPIGKSGDPNPYQPGITYGNGYSSGYIGLNSTGWKNWEEMISRYYYDQYIGTSIKPLFKPANIGIFQNQEPYKSNKDKIMMKTTFVSHGYQSTREMANLDGTANRAKDFLIRGECAEPLNQLIGAGPKYNINDNQYWNDRPRQNLYWQCLWMLHIGMDVFNMRDIENFENSNKNPHAWDEARDTFQFFSERAGIKNAIGESNQRQGGDQPWKSKYAFIALREGLSYESTKYVPGPVPTIGTTDAKNRFTAIQTAVNTLLGNDGHVEMNDLDQANKDILPLPYLKDLTGINDINFKIYTGNYTMFITQINPGSTSQGYWNMGKPESDNNGAQQYGRFAKGFKAGKSQMFFDIDKNFVSNINNKNPGLNYQFSIDVIYLDKGNASFSLKYDSDSGETTAYTLTTGDTNTFIKKTFLTTDARFKNNLTNNADIILEKISGNPIFHMIEVVKIDDGVIPNDPPVLTALNDATIDEGCIHVARLSATDTESDPITFTSPGLPPFATLIDNGDGTGAVVFAPENTDNGVYPITINAEDPTGSSTQNFTLAVGNLPADSTDNHEFEDLVIADSSGDAYDWLHNANAGGSGSANFIHYKSDAIDDFIYFDDIKIPGPGDYEIYVGVQRSPNAAQVRLLQINPVTNEVIGDQDLYSTGWAFQELYFGSKTFTSGGNRKYGFQVIGQNPDSTGFKMRLDYIRFEKQ